MSADPYSELAEALRSRGPRRPVVGGPESSKPRLRRSGPQDRSRDHAVYAAPHVPPKGHHPSAAVDLDTFRIPVLRPHAPRWLLACGVAFAGLASFLAAMILLRS